MHIIPLFSDIVKHLIAYSLCFSCNFMGGSSLKTIPNGMVVVWFHTGLRIQSV